MFDEQMTKIDERPDNFGVMKDASSHAKYKGPCGDTAEVWLRIDGGKIRKATYMSDGCGYSNACCSAAATVVQMAVFDYLENPVQKSFKQKLIHFF